MEPKEALLMEKFKREVIDKTGGSEPEYHIWLYEHREELKEAGIYIHPSHLLAGKNACGNLIVTTN